MVGAEASHDLDPLKVLIDLTGLGTPRYQTADWLHAHRAIDTDWSDHRRIEAQLSSDDGTTPELVVDALTALTERARPPGAPGGRLTSPGALELETAMLPRDAFSPGRRRPGRAHPAPLPQRSCLPAPPRRRLLCG